MKFPTFREFRPLRRGDESRNIVEYLSIHLIRNFKQLSLGLTKLSFADNFEGFIVENLSIPAGVEVEITNRLDNIPSQRLIIRGGEGSENVVDGDTAWSQDKVYLKNVGGMDALVTVQFLK